MTEALEENKQYKKHWLIQALFNSWIQRQKAQLKRQQTLAIPRDPIFSYLKYVVL